MTIFLMPSPCNKSPAFVFLIYLLPLILSITPSHSIVFTPGLAFSLFHYNGSLHISHPAHLPTVGIPPHSSPSFPLTCGVPQRSILGPVLFNLYTTPLRSLISASSISHLLYADDTQLFISILLKNFSSAINNLQSSNHLTLNPSKTEFFLSVSLNKPLK